MKYLVILLFAVFPLGQLTRFNIPGTEIVLHLNDFVVFAAVLFWLFKRPKISGPLVKPLLFFGAAIAMSLLLNVARFTPRELLTAALYPLRFFTYAGLYFLFRDLSTDNQKLAFRWLLIVALITTAFGLAQYIFVPDVAFLAAFDWDDHYYRLIGTFLDPGFTGAILVLGLLVAYFLRSQAVIPIYIALALTYSRASYLMYLLGFAAVAYYKKSLKIAAIAALILGATILVLPKSTGEGTKLSRENSIIARINNWKQTVTVWSEHPLFGVGFNTYRYVVGASPQSHSGGADSSIFLVLATTGTLGVASYLYLLWTMWKMGKSNLLFAASFLAVVAHSFFNNTLFYPWVMEWLWIALAIRGYTSR